MHRVLCYLTFFLTLVNVSILITLYVIAYRYDHVQRSIQKTQKELEQEHNTSLALKAEWSYLNKPQRLAYLARTYLKLDAANPSQFKLNTDESDA